MKRSPSLLVLPAALAASIAAQCPLVTDINMQSTPFDGDPGIARVGEGSSFAHGMLRCGSEWFFVASSAGAGAELWKTDGTPAGTVMVKDINPGIPGSDPFWLTCCNGRVYFQARTETDGEELWVSDGTAAGTYMVSDIVAGSADSRPSNLCCLNNKVLFTATDGVSGFELWSSDGTAAGTVMLLDIRPGPLSGGPTYAKVDFLGSRVYFQANDGVHGDELWVTDGTATGTVMLVDIWPGAGSSAPTYFVENPSNPLQLLFRADDGSNGRELWRTDGSIAGTTMVRDINPGPAGGSIDMFHSRHSVVGGQIFFSADDGTHGIELWASDGTAAGTVLVQDIEPGLGSSLPTMFRANGGALFFQATTAADGAELYLLAGGVAVQVKDIQQGVVGSEPEQITPLSTGAVVFSADNGPSRQGRELWISDGSRSGTRLLLDIWPGAADSDPAGFTPLIGGTAVLFFAGDGTSGGSGREVYVTDGTAAGTGLFRDLYPGGASNSASPNFMTASRGSTLLFSADDGLTGRELWKADASGATLLADINSGGDGSDPAEFIDLWNGSGLLTVFRADDGSKGKELWRTDGTAAGTAMIKDIDNGPGSSNPNNFGRLRDRVFFSARTGATGYELWATDGTAAGTVLVKDIVPGSTSSTPHAFTALGDTLFFVALTPTHGLELWKTDGTAAGTVLVKDIRPGSVGSAPLYLTPYGDVLLFRANDGPNGVELWRTDGTAAGTAMVVGLAPASSGGHPTDLTRYRDFVYFVATTAANGTELWRTDGTAAGTTLVADTWPGSGSGRPAFLTVSQGLLFFAADDGLSGRELFVSDGTAAGTVRVADIYAGPLGSSPSAFAPAGHGIYFSATDATVGDELFFSDGSAAGTYLVCDLNQGPESSHASTPVAVDGRLYFTADDALHGFELFRLGTAAAVVETFGQSCGAALPTLAATQPVLGAVATLSGTGTATNPRLLSFSTRTTPFPLPGVLAPDCAVWTDLTGAATLLLGPGATWSLPFPIPADPGLIGYQLSIQSFEGNAPFSASNAVQVTLGN